MTLTLLFFLTAVVSQTHDNLENKPDRGLENTGSLLVFAVTGLANSLGNFFGCFAC